MSREAEAPVSGDATRSNAKRGRYVKAGNMINFDEAAQ
jgi:hypothetical protein